jgi:enamine deaminase RidA (YjgF/YER057c/UK114 family)
MKRKSIILAKNPNRNIPGIKGTSIKAAFCDAVRVDLPTHSIIYASGKLGTDDEGDIVGATMAEQTERTLQNLAEVLATEGATLHDVVRTLIFVTVLDEDSLRQIHEVRNRYLDPDNLPASTLVQCEKLVRPGGMIEIEAEAIIVNS